jgi:hypothetical protein
MVQTRIHQSRLAHWLFVPYRPHHDSVFSAQYYILYFALPTVWNFIGAIGFTLCGALGYATTSSSKVVYQSDLATFWGGWAFLIGSVIQLYEAVNPLG